MTTRQRILLIAVVAVTAVVATRSLLAQQPGPDMQPRPAASAVAKADPYTVEVTPEMRAHQHWVDGLYFLGTAYGIVVLLAILSMGISRRIRDWAESVTRRPFVRRMAFFAVFVVVVTVFTLPMDWLSDYVIPHKFNLSDQSLLGWLWDQTKAMLVSIVIGAPIAALALAGMARFRRWWLALWLGAVPITVFLMAIAPVLLDPVFNNFQPLKDPSLRRDLFAMAVDSGIPNAKVLQADKSKQTKTMDAYVNGLGPTTRIVLWDTIIAKMDSAELRFVVAHELGHYVMHHVWKSVAFFLAVLSVVLFVAHRVIEWAIARWGREWGFSKAHDAAAIPLLLLVLIVSLFLLSPVFSAFSRSLEHSADVYALDHTRLADAGARAFVKLAKDSKILPDPNAFIRFWRYSHPTLVERIELCRQYIIAPPPQRAPKPAYKWKPGQPRLS